MDQFPENNLYNVLNRKLSWIDGRIHVTVRDQPQHISTIEKENRTRESMMGKRYNTDLTTQLKQLVAQGLVEVKSE